MEREQVINEAGEVFTIGIQVRRVSEGWLEMKRGDIATITDFVGDNNVHLKEFVGAHSIDSLKPIQEIDIVLGEIEKEIGLKEEK